MLFWDIDGTLLTTARAGIAAWEQAVLDCTGVTRTLENFPTAGLTDHEIAEALMNSVPSDRRAPLEQIVARYETLLPECLPSRVGSVLPGVRDILESVRHRQDVRSMLLTGNTANGARAKLAHYGLIEYFEAGGAFSSHGASRPAIARAALRMARALLGDGTPLDPVVIGDTPADIRCGNAIGARVIAVATGSYALPALRAARPWWSTPRLPDPEMFLARLGVPGAGPATQ
ncbi:MAG TPA: haloacid dehalogenase-like hydrolase [Gemmatimonadaceae bacterium]|nr:haloacid dehalogenase-like hydrolase [Gemmatimonadaceae bacterium]